MTTTRLVMLCLFVAQSAAAQTARPASATLQGIVVKWGTAEPLTKAAVELRRAEDDGAAPFVATTAGDGIFRFGGLPSGQYRVVAKRSGYVNGEYGQRWPGGVGLPLTITAGEVVGSVQIAMTPTAAISGRIRDRFDQPIGNVEVQALKATYPDGRRTLTKVASAQSDDRGEYRLFWLPPGRYYLSARHPDIGGGMMRLGGFRISRGGVQGPNGPTAFEEFRSSGDTSSASPIDPVRAGGSKERYLPVFFPGALDQQSALPIDLAPGAEQTATDFTIDPVPLQRVRGRAVYESNGEAAMSAKIQWLSSSGASSGDDQDPLFGSPLGAAPECCEGAFEIGLTPGAYTLIAAVNNLNGRVGVGVGYGDVDGIVIPISQGFNLTGRVTFEGRTPATADLAALRISLAMDPPVPGLAPTSYSVVLPNGSLTLAAGRGDFRVNISPMLNLPGAYRTPVRGTVPSGLQNAYVKSIRLGGADVLNGGLHLDRQPDAPLEIVIGTTPGALEGVVVNERREPVPNVSVALLPDAAKRARIDLFKSTASDASGRFHVAGIPPGDYVAFAFDGAEEGAWRNPEFVTPYEARGTLIRIGDAAAASVELTALPPAR
jgi:hypothetical protein